MENNETGVISESVIENIKNLTPNERELFIARIDEKMRRIRMEDILKICKKLNYVFPIDYAIFYANQLDLPIKKSTFNFNGVERTINLLLDMEENKEYSILKFINFDSQYIPFALLDDSNFLCFDKQDHSLVYYSVQNKTIEKLADNWESFEKGLYQGQL